MYSAGDLQEIIRPFGFDLREFQEVGLGSKWMGRRYAVGTDRGRLFVKVRSEWWPVGQAEYVGGLIRHLASKGFPSPRLHLTKTGEPFIRWRGHICECYDFIEGKPFTPGNLDQTAAAGRTLASLHSLTASYAPPRAGLGQECGYPTIPRVMFYADHVRRRFSTHPEAQAAVGRLVDRIRALDQSASLRSHRAFGIAHGDYHPANLLFAGSAIVAVCDFDLAEPAPLAYDLAYFLYRTAGRARSAGGGVARLDRTPCRVFLEAYSQHLASSQPPVPRGEVGSELLRFAWHNALLFGQTGRDPARFLVWCSDTEALEQDLSRWAEE